MAAKTITVAQTENDCEYCIAEGINPPKKLKAQIDTDSAGIGQRLSMKCDTHGPIKTLYNFPVTPVNRKLFLELFEDQFGPLAPEPKPQAWV